jgi:hypothetical protein
MAIQQHIIEIETGGWAGDANASAFTLPAEPSVQCGRLTRLIPIGEDDQIPNVGRQFQGAQARCREGRPCRIAGSQHGGEAGLYAFADHEYVAGIRKSHGAATAWAEHHSIWIKGCFTATISCKKGAVNRHRLAIDTAHKSDHRWPNVACGMSQPRIKPQHIQQWSPESARSEMGLNWSVG